jgi:hypothetical protein
VDISGVERVSGGFLKRGLLYMPVFLDLFVIFFVAV